MKVAYAVPHPVTGAVGQRVLGVSRALLATGRPHEVVVLGPSHDALEAELPGLTYGVAEAFADGTRTTTEKLLRRLRLGRDTVAALDAMASPPDLVIIYGGGAQYMKRIQHWAHARDVRVAADMVEWYDSSHLPLGKLGPYALDNYLMMTHVAPRCDGIIAISNYLARHFSEKGNDSVVIVPPVMDTSALAQDDEARTHSDRVELVYCGDPGKKDRLDLVLRSAIDLDPNGTRLRLTIAGPDPKRVADLAGVDELPPVVTAVGRVPREECVKLVRNAHWMPLIRDDKRFARAGFPTKVAEAMSVGTPIISNLTSDLGELLVDGDTGIMVEAADLDSVRKAIVRALSVTHIDHVRMSRSATQSARKYFDYQRLVTPLNDWLELIIDGR